MHPLTVTAAPNSFSIHNHLRSCSHQFAFFMFHECAGMLKGARIGTPSQKPGYSLQPHGNSYAEFCLIIRMRASLHFYAFLLQICKKRVMSPSNPSMRPFFWLSVCACSLEPLNGEMVVCSPGHRSFNLIPKRPFPVWSQAYATGSISASVTDSILTLTFLFYWPPSRFLLVEMLCAVI